MKLFVRLRLLALILIQTPLFLHYHTRLLLSLKLYMLPLPLVICPSCREPSIIRSTTPCGLATLFSQWRVFADRFDGGWKKGRSETSRQGYDGATTMTRECRLSGGELSLAGRVRAI
jgi:hypothetical protein